MIKQAVAEAAGLEAIDRLEQKMKLLVGMIGQLREEQARSTDQVTRLTEERDALRARLADAEAGHAELAALREERDQIRTRVADMLEQLESV